MARAKLQTYTSSTGASYTELPWPGLQRFERDGGRCARCGTSTASHPAIGCEMPLSVAQELADLL